MPLPNPDYLTNENFNWNNTQFPAVLLSTDAAAGGIKRTIKWTGLDTFDQKTIHDLIMGYATRDAKTEALALTMGAGEAYQVINYNSTLVGGSIAGLIDGVIYTASAIINGAVNPISVIGATSDTITNLLVKINADLTGATMTLNVDGNFEITSTVASAGQVVELVDQNLFRLIPNFKIIEEKRVGITTIQDIFDLNFKNAYQTYTSLLHGKLQEVPNTTNQTSSNIGDIYFNHGTGVWIYIHTGLPV